jgi:3-hydroxybutyryl-CoA dehydrogenase
MSAESSGVSTPTTVAVIGAGVMGTGVALTLARGGHHAIVVDLSDQILERARGEVRQALRLAKLRGRGDTEDLATIAGRIQYTTDYQAISAASLVVENVPEERHAKEEVYRRIDALCQPGCVFAANTSAIPITWIATRTGRPAQVIGAHFMNPVPLTTMVEIVRGHHTSDETVAFTSGLLGSVGLECIVVGDSPGFVTNRILMPLINEAIFLVHERVAAVAEVDRMLRGCFGHPMGPLETADLIGLDTILRSIRVLHDCFQDSKYRPCPLLVRMVDAGLLGRKSGEGFYRYATADAR